MKYRIKMFLKSIGDVNEPHWSSKYQQHYKSHTSNTSLRHVFCPISSCKSLSYLLFITWLQEKEKKLRRHRHNANDLRGHGGRFPRLSAKSEVALIDVGPEQNRKYSTFVPSLEKHNSACRKASKTSRTTVEKKFWFLKLSVFWTIQFQHLILWVRLFQGSFLKK